MDKNTPQMTPQERVLALDAACCACEGAVPNALLKPLQDWLDNHIQVILPNVDFGAFLVAQHAAVKALDANPHVWGG